MNICKKCVRFQSNFTAATNIQQEINSYEHFVDPKWVGWKAYIVLAYNCRALNDNSTDANA